MSNDPKYYKEDIKPIKKIEFNIFTNNGVKAYSSVSNDPFGINLPESYDNYEPKKGGLVDLRLGTCDIYLNCTTCGLNSIECPGHFGHTDLAEPVFHYGFIPYLKSILQCICIQCSKILVEKTDTVFKKNLDKKPEIRFKDIKNLTKNVSFCYNCGTPVGKIKKEEKESTASIRLILERDIGIQEVDEKTGEPIETVKKTLRILTPRDCYNILRNLSETECYILGFNPKQARPEDLIITKFPIPPVIIRPTAKIDFMQSSTMEDALTIMIANIINSNQRVRTQLEKEAITNETSNYNQEISNLLQYHIAVYFDNESISLPKSEFNTGGKTLKSISNRIKAKQGRVRSNLMGKRVDFSARSVITSDPYINIDEVGIPKKVAMELTIPEEVTPFNIKHLTKLIMNGRDEYPGANFVFRTIYKDGKQEIQKIDLKYRKKTIKLNIGDIVARHAINGDYVLFNRQPTLHKPSMMGHKLQVLNRDDTFTLRMNVSVCKPYNADFDGDEMNIHIAQSIQARNELKRIANVKYQIISAKDSNPIIGCVQDALSGCYLLTKLDNKIKGSDVANFLCYTSSDTKNEIDLDKYYTGHEIFSHIIPKGINNTIIKDNKKIFEIVDGNLKLGTLDKLTLSTVKNSIIHFIWDKYGPDKTRRFIDDAQRLALSYLNYHGFTMGIKDCIIDKKTDEYITQLISSKILQYKINLTQYENEMEQINPLIVETNLSSELISFSSEIGSNLKNTLDPTNNFFVCVDSKSKGDLMNLQLIMGCVGQKSIEGTRIKKKVENRVLPIFHRDDDSPEARGFIKSSFLKGLQTFEFFYDAMAGREGLIDTAIKTASTGYIQRQIIKILEDLVIKYDNTNRTSNNKIIQYVYGENGIESSNQIELKINLISYDNEMVKNSFCFDKSEVSKIEKTHKIKNINKWNEMYYNKIINYRNELRKIQMIANNNYITIENKYMLPVNLFRLTQDYSNDKVNLELNPQEILDDIEELLNSDDLKLIPGLKSNNKIFVEDDKAFKYIFEIALHDYLCPKKCIFTYGLSKKEFKNLLNDIKFNFIKALVQPGEMIGIIAAQSIGEPTSQMSLLENEKNKIIIKNKITKEISLSLIEIGIFCNNIIDKYPELTNNTGHLNSVETDLSSLDNEYYIIGVDKYEKTHWNKISHISRHPVNGRVMRVKTRSGRSVETTCSHSHLIRENQTVVPIMGSDLRIGMRIPVLKYIDNLIYDTITVINNITYKLDYSFGRTIGLCLTEELVSSNNNILNRAFISPNEFKRGLIQAYFDINCKFENNISITSDNKQLIKDFALLLNYFDIFANVTDNKLIIDNKYNKLYKDNIGSLVHSDKLDKLSYNNTDTIIDNITGLNNIIRSCCIKLNVQEPKFNNDTINRDDLGTYIYLFQKHSDCNKVKNELLILIQAYDSNVIWDEIVDIDIYDIDQSKYVYDFTVPQNQTFMTDSGIIVHNTLNTKHKAGVASNSSVNMGVPRIEELLHNSKDIKTPQMVLYFDEELQTEKSKVNKILSYLTYLSIKELINSAEIYYDMGKDDEYSNLLKKDNVSMPFFINNQKVDVSSLSFVFRLKLSIEKLYEKETTILDIKSKFISYWSKNFTNVKNMKKIEKEIFTKISRCAILSNNSNNIIHIRFNMISFNYNLLTEFLKIVLEQITLKGIDNISNSEVISKNKYKIDDNGKIVDGKEYIIYTTGINLKKIKYIKGINYSLCSCNDVNTIYSMYGIEATRQILINEFNMTFMAGGSTRSVNHNHMSVLVDMMTNMGIITSIDRHGLNKLDTEPLARATFEKTMDQFLNAAVFNEVDNIKSVSSRIMMGRVIPGGTGSFELFLDTNKLENSEYTKDEKGGRLTFVLLEEESLFKDIIKYGFNKNDFFLPSN